MNTESLRSHLPRTVLAPAVVLLVVLLAALVVAVALAAALAPGFATNSIAGTDVSPFRWA